MALLGINGHTPPDRGLIAEVVKLGGTIPSEVLDNLKEADRLAAELAKLDAPTGNLKKKLTASSAVDLVRSSTDAAQAKKVLQNARDAAVDRAAQAWTAHAANTVVASLSEPYSAADEAGKAEIKAVAARLYKVDGRMSVMRPSKLPLPTGTPESYRPNLRFTRPELEEALWAAEDLPTRGQLADRLAQRHYDNWSEQQDRVMGVRAGAR